MQKKSGIMKSELDAMPLFLLDNLLKQAEELNFITSKPNSKISQDG